MKHIYLFLFVVLFQFTNAQETNLQKANRYFDKTYYSEALPYYESALQNSYSAVLLRKLADCYFYTNDFANANRIYTQLANQPSDALDEAFWFNYSQAAKANGNYEEGRNLYFDFLSKSDNAPAFENYKKQCVTLENVAAIGDRFIISNLEINTPNSEFGAIEHKDQLVFSSVKKNTYFFSKIYKWNNERYLDLIAMPLANIHSADSIKTAFSQTLNTPMHEANAVFTKDGNTAYFTRNYYKSWHKGTNDERVSTLQIYKSEFKNNKWSKAVALPFNNPDFSCEHPALSPDEKTLYFASDMPGSLGSFDIYEVSVDGEAYGVPRNLGATINTNRKEQFPFVANDGKLYFSSNGHEGYGNLDVFVATVQGSFVSDPINVGLPINSGFDDFSFNINSDTKNGYFASNRPGGKGNDDIYTLKEIKDLVVEDCKQYIAGTITDRDTKAVIEGAKVVLFNENKNELQTIITGADGTFKFAVNCNAFYSVHASKEAYTQDTKNVSIGKQREKSNDASMILRTHQAIALEGQEIERKKQELELAKIAMQEKLKVEQIAKDKIAKELAKENAAKKAIADAKKAADDAKKAADDAKKLKQEKLEKMLAAEKDVVKVKDQVIIKTDPIYFDYNLSYIRKDSKPILDKVIQIMKKYPDMIVEIGSHTDTRGNANYNRDLSEERAQSTRDYFISKGIPKDKIFAKGYGKSVPIVACQPAESCTEEQHELNRRSEFVVKNL